MNLIKIFFPILVFIIIFFIVGLQATIVYGEGGTTTCAGAKICQETLCGECGTETIDSICNTSLQCMYDYGFEWPDSPFPDKTGCRRTSVETTPCTVELEPCTATATYEYITTLYRCAYFSNLSDTCQPGYRPATCAEFRDTDPPSSQAPCGKPYCTAGGDYGNCANLVLDYCILDDVPPPDLVSQNLTYLPASPLPGNLMTLSGTIKNQGGSNAGVSQTRLRIDIGNNGDWDSDSWPTPPVNQATGALTAGSTETETWNNVWTATAGTHKYEICADISGAIAESAELNNCTVAFFTVSAAADFSLQAAPNNITAFPTDSKTSTITVVPSGGFNNQVILSIQSISSNPAGCISTSFSPDNKPQPPDDANRFLNLTTNSCPVGLNSDIIVEGKKGVDIRTTTINLKVQINPSGNTSGYAWSENIGYISFSCNHSALGRPLGVNSCASNGGAVPDYGVLTTDSPLYGYAWSENIGWISMNCDQSSVGGIKKCATEGGIDYSVTNTNGTLTGYAWSENIGWISFDDTVNNFYQVKINPTTGIFSGYAWSETVGYINFNSAGPPEYYVQTDWLGANNPPQVPYFPIPGHNTNGVSIYLDELKWKSGDPDFDVLEFDIYLDTDDTKIGKGVGPCPDGNCLLEVNNITLGGPVDINSDFTYLGLGLGDLLENKFYYWRVVALDTTGSATFAFSDANDATLLDFEPWRFKTGQKEPKIVTSTELNVPTQSLSFGNVTVGATKTMYVVVCNFGDKQLKTEKISLTSGANFSVGDKIYDDGGISHDRPNGTPPREYNLGVTTDGGVAGVCASSSIDQPSYNIVVKFNPLTTGNETDTLTIVSDDLNKPDYFINLDGTGDAPVESPGVDYTPSGGVKVRP